MRSSLKLVLLSLMAVLVSVVVAGSSCSNDRSSASSPIPIGTRHRRQIIHPRSALSSNSKLIIIPRGGGGGGIGEYCRAAVDATLLRRTSIVSPLLSSPPLAKSPETQHKLLSGEQGTTFSLPRGGSAANTNPVTTMASSSSCSTSTSSSSSSSSNEKPILLRVAFQGEAGAYSEKSLRELLGPNVIAVPRPNFESCYRAVASNECDYAIVPIENSLGGQKIVCLIRFLIFDI